MTLETYEPTPAPRRPRAAVRFGVAFLVGLIAALALGAGALYAYDQQYTGRILPGVRVGNIELAGLTRERGGRARRRRLSLRSARAPSS